MRIINALAIAALLLGATAGCKRKLFERDAPREAHRFGAPADDD